METIPLRDIIGSYLAGPIVWVRLLTVLQDASRCFPSSTQVLVNARGKHLLPLLTVQREVIQGTNTREQRDWLLGALSMSQSSECNEFPTH